MEQEDIRDRLDAEADELDLSRDEDLSIGIMNLISLEEHLFFTHEKTGDPAYLEMLAEIREKRAESMEEIVNETQGEEWCISKHLLSAAMRFKETADKMLDRDEDGAAKFYDRAFSLYAMFWAINFDIEEEHGIIGQSEAVDEGTQKAAISASRENQHEGNGNSEANQDTAEASWLANAKQVVKKAVDCCKEL